MGKEGDPTRLARTTRCCTGFYNTFSYESKLLHLINVEKGGLLYTYEGIQQDDERILFTDITKQVHEHLKAYCHEAYAHFVGINLYIHNISIEDSDYLFDFMHLRQEADGRYIAVYHN